MRGPFRWSTCCASPRILSRWIGVKRAANSVLFFSDRPIHQFSGTVAVTEETSTSFRLLQILLEARYGLSGIQYGRMASAAHYEGGANGVLVIGDDAIRARLGGLSGWPWMVDLGEEWFHWQGVPFVFARWAARSALRQDVKDIIETTLEKSLLSTDFNRAALADQQAAKRGFDASLIAAYWNDFDFRLGPDHLESVRRFAPLLEKACLTA